MKIVSIKADKQRNLKFGINGLIEIEKMIGKSLSDLGEGASLGDLRAMLFVGLKWEDKELTPEKTGEVMDEIISEKGIEYMSEKLSEALEGSVGNKPFPKE